MRRQAKTRHAKPSTLRIIGGQWRGRKLSFSDTDGLRPTGDRIRETLFNWLAGDIVGARCLDLFAGSGALSFEALSRGAATVIAIESNAKACRAIEAAAEQLKATSLALQQADATQWINSTPAEPMDIVFIDPPFSANLWHQILAQLIALGWLAQGALIYLETPIEHPLNAAEIDPQLIPLRSKRAGQVNYQLWQYDCSPSGS
ncbi:16S rRNA (guanine(966)-N(2))-methyltransferase RsmD [bacterium]|nr:16S rRNA (guanine(966)-N(2))-methyltransferase RsmD [bacterium]